GCGERSAVPRAASADPEDDAPLLPGEVGEGRIRIAGGASTLTRRDEAGKVILEARSGRSETEVSREGEPSTRAALRQVDGSVFRDGRKVSGFKAPAGRYLEEQKILALEGGVTLTSVEHGLTLRSDRLRWDEATRTFRAEGGVTLTGDRFVAGPTAVLVSSEDLRRFGSPDRFKPTR
ncbi:MAG: LPS export ABC transporter periplasmic protein LptC, partial [Fimbriimonadaceae bacterium]|nr:LPS export ABC transporter periplasmic protein LptC [Fimbriimonadaceae bacterium]